MVHTNGSNGKTKRPRPLGMAQVAEAMAAGGSIRNGTYLRGAFPCWEFQVFNEAGEFLAPVAASALPQAITTYGFDQRKGVNR